MRRSPTYVVSAARCLVLAVFILLVVSTAGCSRTSMIGTARGKGRMVALERKPAAAGPVVKGTTSVRTPGGGVVVFAKTADGSDSGPADVFRQDLATGKVERLVCARRLPKGVSGCAVSPDGSHLVIIETDFGGANMWMWTRFSGDLRRLGHEDDTGPDAQWSPSGNHLLIVASGKAKLYSIAGAKYVQLGSCSRAFWSARDDRLIMVVGPDDGKCTVYSVAVSGVRRVLFRWRRPVQELALSPSGRDYVFSDDRRAYLVAGGKPRSLGFRFTENDWAGFTFAYDRAGMRLAMFLNRTSGEPHVSIEESLWLVNPKTGAKSLLWKWQDSALSLNDEGGVVCQHSLLGWVGRSSRVMLSTGFQWNAGSLSNVRRDRHELSTYNTAVKNGEEKAVFSSGEGCPALEWLPAANK